MIPRPFDFRSSLPFARAVLVTVLLTVLAHATQAQEIQPEDVGFAPFTVETDTNTVDVYVSSGGMPADTTTKAPLVVLLEGSGYGPVFAGGPPDSVFHSLFVRPEELPGHHYAVIGKPAAPFWMTDNVQREPGA